MPMQTLSPITIEKAKCQLASISLFDYCKIVDSDEFYNEETAPYLKEMCDAIQEFENDDNEALIINMPPRHGKTRTVNNAITWLLGRNPRYKIMEGTYNTALSRKSSKRVRNNISDLKREGRIVFSQVFPNVKLKYGSASVDYWGLEGNQEDNYLATAPNGSSTGIGADFLVLDDTIKNKYEAYHKDYLNQLFEDWFQDTLYSRLEGKRKIIIVMTRWATGDMAGRLIRMLTEQGRKFRLITKKAYNKETDTMLNSTILNKIQYQNLLKTIGEDIVKANYDQEPVDLKGKLYKTFLTYNPADIKTKDNPNGTIVFKDIRARADTADKGEDYLCMIIYGVTYDRKAYILDIYYTQEDMEITEQEAAKRLLKYNPYVFRPESNNGGRGWSRAVEKEYKKLGGVKTIFKPYTQTLNKEARILSNATTVQNMIYFPMDWQTRYRDYYMSMFEYQRTGKNEHDDAQDCTTSIAEELDTTSGIRFG